MGVEFSSPFAAGSKTGLVSSVAAELTSFADLQVLNVTESQIAVRFSANPLREEWPEDARIYFEPAGVFLLIHDSTREQELDLVARLNAMLERHDPGFRLAPVDHQ
jgi:hypothetical protein